MGCSWNVRRQYLFSVRIDPNRLQSSEGRCVAGAAVITKEATVGLICIQFLISVVHLSVISECSRRQQQHVNTAVAVGCGGTRHQHQY